MWFGDIETPFGDFPMLDHFLGFAPDQIAKFSDEELIGALRYWESYGTGIYKAAHVAAQTDHYPIINSPYRKKPITQKLRIPVFERDRYRCVKCGTWENLTVDHIIPESRGGLTILENLQTLCRSCNSKKGTK